MFAECVVNISEGRDRDLIDAVAAAAGPELLDVHADAHHHRAVITLGGPLAAVEQAARSVAAEAVRRIDLRTHQGVHPRFGAVDVVPFVPLGPDRAAPALPAAPGGMDAAVAARDRFARWAADDLAVPCFLYGPGRTLPEVRRGAFTTLVPDTGPSRPHPTAGAMAVGARPVLVAYNVWIDAPGGAAALARTVAAAIRAPAIRALGLDLDGAAQVSCNLVDPARTGPDHVYDSIADLVARAGGTVVRAELVGLAPAATLSAVPRERWAELDLAVDRTIEARLDARRR
ncbi:MAG: hypothetical protein M0007_16310 [Actinomycetota bacterium]|jgi:glutamate formiminotransferase|nr:hypothetical protein [Actinomycetota bacterium]